jgi:hypothetical protein
MTMPGSETLVWHSADEKPDSDITVLMWFPQHTEWHAGWWDGDVWRDASNGAEVTGVTHWAEPEGPAA